MLRTVCLAIFAVSLAAGQSSSIVESVPSAYRQEAAAIVNDKSDADRARLAAAFAKDKQPSKQTFLLSLLDTDPSSKVRKAILDSLGRSMNEEVARVMLRHAETDPDADLAISALEHYRAYEMARLRKVLEHRMAMTEATDDPKTKLLFGQEQERWISLVHGTMLPAFLRQPPPEFAVRPAGVPIRVLAFGDYGDGRQEQRDTAAAMLEYDKNHPFDFGITLGDNFLRIPGDADQRSELMPISVPN